MPFCLQASVVAAGQAGKHGRREGPMPLTLGRIGSLFRVLNRGVV